MMNSSILDANGRRILVIAAHPDDEVLGCGGTIAKHFDNGDIVEILIVSQGVTSRNDSIAVDVEISNLRRASLQSAQLLGASKIHHLDLPDNRLDSLDRLDLIKLLEQYIFSFDPHVVYVHHSGDVNIDHRRIHEAVVTACRPLPGIALTHLLSFEIASSTEWQTPGSAPVFLPNWFVDISNQWERKRQALTAYSSEMRQFPHPRSIKALEHLAKWRGAQVGVNAAEAFCLLRSIG